MLYVYLIWPFVEDLKFSLCYVTHDVPFLTWDGYLHFDCISNKFKILQEEWAVVVDDRTDKEKRAVDTGTVVRMAEQGLSCRAPVERTSTWRVSDTARVGTCLLCVFVSFRGSDRFSVVTVLCSNKKSVPIVETT